MYEEAAFRWADDHWRAAAEAWIDERVEEGGEKIIGPITGVRFLPWSAVLRAPTSGGDVYFKACGPSQAHEPALTALLYRARPDCIVPVLAADPERGWLLSSDGGPTLTAVIENDGDETGHWSRVLALQAGLQRELTPKAGQLLALGVLDRRPAGLPGMFHSILDQPAKLLAGEPGALTTAGIDQLRALKPQLKDMCAELAAVGPPDTFVHDDFHEDHIFAHRQPSGDWRYLFMDFGDACVGHPFMQLVSQPRFAANRFEIEADPIQRWLREFYLSHWLDFGRPETLERSLSLALIAGCIIRALTWIDACGEHLNEVPPYLREAYRSRVAFWMMQIPRRVEGLDG